MVALDGRSGAGKSTVARALGDVLSATRILSDDFFAAELTRADWEARGASERARDAIDAARPELVDTIDLDVLIDAPAEGAARLALREAPEFLRAVDAVGGTVRDQRRRVHHPPRPRISS